MPRHNVHETHHTIFQRIRNSQAVSIGNNSSVWGCWFGCSSIIVRTPDEMGHVSAVYNPQRDQYALAPGKPKSTWWKKAIRPKAIQKADRINLREHDGRLMIIVDSRGILIDKPLYEVVMTYSPRSTWGIGTLEVHGCDVPCGVAFNPTGDIWAVCAPMIAPDQIPQAFKESPYLSAESFWHPILSAVPS